MPLTRSCIPVSRATRLGEQVGSAMYVLLNRTDCRSNWSTFGVFTKGCPIAPKVLSRWSSVSRKIMLAATAPGHRCWHGT